MQDELFEDVIGDCRLIFGMSLYSWDEVPEGRLREDISREVVSGERVMAVNVFLGKGAVVPSHSYESERAILRVYNVLDSLNVLRGFDISSTFSR